MPVRLLFGVLENIQQLWDDLQSRCVFFTLVLMFSLLFWSSDGTTQALGTCLRDFRNKPYPIRAKITYYKKTLTVGEMKENFDFMSQIEIITIRYRMRPFHSRCLLAGWLLCPQVMINNGFTPNRDDYEFCTKVENMIFPTEGFFGISAATGGLAGTLFFLLKTLKRVWIHLVLSAPEASASKCVSTRLYFGLRSSLD